MKKQLIYSKMASIMKETKAIGKTEQNRQQGFMFRGIDNVMNELHELFSRNEVFILPEVQDFTTQERPTKSGGVNTFTRVRVKFVYMTTDGSSVQTVNVGEAMDSGDKGMNKAMSIALKYSLTQMFLIPTAEAKDPDYNTPEDTDFILLALQEVESAQSVQALSEIYNRYKDLHNDARFMSALSSRKKQLQ